MKAKSFAMLAVALMIGSAFLCCSLADANTSASDTENLELGKAYSKTFGSSSTSFYDSYYGYSGSVPGLSFTVVDMGTWGSQSLKYLSVSGTPTAVGTYTVTVNREGGGFDAFPYQYTDTITFVVTNPSYTVTYDGNGGTPGEASRTVTKGTAVTLPNASKENCTFLGWYTDPNGGSYAGGNGSSYTVNGNATLYAHWKSNTLSVNSVPVQYGVSGQSISFTVSASTDPSAAVTYSVSSNTVSNGMGTMNVSLSGNTITCSSVTVGTYSFTLTASASNYPSSSTTVTVQFAPVLQFMNTPTAGALNS